MQKAIIIDLDDTLINTHKRHYLVFSNFMAGHNAPVVTFEDYLEKRKTQKLSNKQLVQTMLPLQTAAFEQFWLENIESAACLNADELLVDVTLLEAIRQKGVAVIVLSLRSNHTTAMQQVQGLPISSLIDEFIFVKHAAGTNPKTGYLKALTSKYHILAFIGDAATDMQAAEEAGINFYAVKTGLYPVTHKYTFTTINEAQKAIIQHI